MIKLSEIFSLKRLAGILLILLDILLLYGKYIHKGLSGIVAMHPILLVLILAIALYLIFHIPATASAKEKKVDLSRRKFLTFSATLAHDEGFQAISNTVGKSVSSFTGKRNPKSKTPIFPPGGSSYEEFKTTCNSCMACIEACPNRILEPDVRLGQGVIPRISFNNGWCSPDCLKCVEVCPTEALKKMTLEEKNNIQIGHAIWIRENCIATEDKTCRECEKACYAKCIEMVQNGRRLYPIINTSSCTGCGACENVCPASPLKGIYVEAFPEHRMING